MDDKTSDGIEYCMSYEFWIPFRGLSTVDKYTPNLEGLYQNKTRRDVVSSSYIDLSFFAKYEIVLNSNGVGSPGDCGASLYYRIIDNCNCGDSDNIHFYDVIVTWEQHSTMFNVRFCECKDDNDYSYPSDYCANCFGLAVDRWYCTQSHLCGIHDS